MAHIGVSVERPFLKFLCLCIICKKQNYFYGFKSSSEIAECTIGPEEATQVRMKAVSAITWPSTMKGETKFRWRRLKHEDASCYAHRTM